MASLPVFTETEYADLPDAPAFPPEFLAWLQSQEQDAQDSGLDGKRKVALDFYNGEPFGNEQEGRSQVVTRDVAEVIDYMLASVLRTMVSGDRVVEFEAMADEDRDAIAEANEAVRQQFMNGQDGFRVLHDSLKAGLLEKTGAVKTFVESRPSRQTADVDEFQLASMYEQGIQIDAAEEVKPGATDELTGEPLEPAIFRISYVQAESAFPDVPIPNEELLVAKDARSIAEAIYHAHKVRTTVSGLREMDFRVDESLIDYGSANDGNSLADARGDYRGDSYRDAANRTVWLLEEYCRYDLDGDGIAELLRVQRCGRQIFTVEPVDESLIEEWCPFPMQHRRVGQSLADKCMDIQVVRSVLLRQSLDNLYLSNAPRTLISESSIGDSTIDDLLTVQPGALVRYIGNNPPVPLTTPFVAESSFQALQFMADERASRTGITPLNQGLDADSLNQTATGVALQQAAGQQMEEYVARNFAEFVGRVFRKKYRLMRAFGQPLTVMIDGQLKQVDPTQWPEDVRVIIRAGLGTGRKESRVQSRMLALQVMQGIASSESRVVQDDNVYHMAKGLFEDMGLGALHELLTDPAQLPPAEPQPDPAMAKAQADAMLQAKRLEMDEQEAALKQQLAREEAAAKIQLMREEAAARLELDRQKAAAEAELARRQQDFEMQMAREQMALQREQAAHKADLDERAAVSKKRPGGRLDA